MDRKVLDRLYELSREIKLLEQSIAVLSWDQETYMPVGAIEDRASQLELLETVLHNKSTSTELGDLFADMGVSEDNPEGNGDAGHFSPDRAFLRVFYRDYRKKTKLPAELVAKLAHRTSIARNKWAHAREQSDFSLFSPQLKELLILINEKAERLGYDDHPYDALLDEYEPGTKTETVDRVFKTAQDDIAALLGWITETTQVDDSVIHKSYPIDKQHAFCGLVLKDIGFDLGRGRMDISAHPFTTGLGSDDIRLTTRYREDYFNSGIFSVIHEAGHGMYEQGFANDIRGTVLADGTSLGIHESQSRTWENIIGRSFTFWLHYYPILKNFFPENFKDVRLEDFWKAVNKVEPSFIRVEADEVTYNLHIILRFELEKKLITGDLSVDDLPGAWNETSERIFGIAPNKDSEGVLQDIHWSMGAIGYFPTYALGNLYSAQFYYTMKEQLPESEQDIADGKFDGILYWLRENIHRHGRVRGAEELCNRITGEPLNPSYFTEYLKEKYSTVYGV